ncbi:MAG: hypothetical protein R6V03_00625 [Kiritimatiellia bacterium]
MRNVFIRAIWGIVFVTAVSSGRAENLCFNGSFDHEEDPLKGWNYDYAWTENEYYKDNASHVEFLKMFDGKRNVVAVTDFHGDFGEGRIESKPIPYDHESRLRCTLDIRGPGSLRLYFAGYKWRPGIRPHDDPELKELRKIYKSHAWVGNPGKAWKRISFEVPMKDISKMAKKHLRHVRFWTVYIYVVEGDAYVDNVKVVRIN